MKKKKLVKKRNIIIVWQLNGIIIILTNYEIDRQQKNSMLKRKLLLFELTFFRIFILLFNRDMGIIRDIARKNYTMYCVQENLLDLKATQMAQKKLMDDIEEFKEVYFVHCLNQI